MEKSTSKITHSTSYESFEDIFSRDLTADQRVNHVSRYVLNEDEMEEPVDLLHRAEFNPPDAERVDMVATRAFQGPQGIAFIPVLEEDLDPDNYLAGGHASLWFSTKMGGGGVGRSVDLTKKSEDKDDKERIPDEARQKKLDNAFAGLKRRLGLSNQFLVNYSINGHTITVFDLAGNLQGKYDLLDKGLDEDYEITGGGGIKQLLHDFHMSDDPESVEQVYKELLADNRNIKKLIKPETGGKLAYSFVAENKGNLAGHAPLGSQMSADANKVLHKDTQHGLYTSTLLRQGLIVEDDRPGRSKKYRVSAMGVDAFTDVKKAALLRAIVMKNLVAARDAKERELSRLNSAVPEDQPAIKRINGEISALTKVYREMSPAEENRMLTVMNEAVLALNTKFTIREPQLNEDNEFMRDEKGVAVTLPVTKTGKEFFRPIRAEDRKANGVRSDDVRGADVKRNDHVDTVAKRAAENFGTMVTENNPKRAANWLYLKKRPGKRQDGQLETDVISVMQQIGARPSSDPSRMRQGGQIEDQKDSKFAQESRAIEFLVVNSTGVDHGLRSYSRESGYVKGVLNRSLQEFNGGHGVRPVRADMTADNIGKFSQETHERAPTSAARGA